jgi:hypothetical protein
VDVFFVQGNIPTENPINANRVLAGQENITKWENNTFGDIMRLDCAENEENGVSYEYFRTVAREYRGRYTHVMKTDENTFINIPGIPPPLPTSPS